MAAKVAFKMFLMVPQHKIESIPHCMDVSIRFHNIEQVVTNNFIKSHPTGTIYVIPSDRGHEPQIKPGSILFQVHHGTSHKQQDVSETG